MSADVEMVHSRKEANSNNNDGTVAVLVIGSGASLDALRRAGSMSLN